MSGRLSCMTGAELVAELVTEHTALTHHRTRCAGRCQDYRDAVTAEDAVLDEMAWRQRNRVGDPISS